MILCNYCSSWIEGVYVQGHLQCELCKQVIEPCCGGGKES